MLSRDTLEAYRRMTTSQRLALTLQMIRENTPRLFDSNLPENGHDTLVCALRACLL